LPIRKVKNGVTSVKHRSTLTKNLTKIAVILSNTTYKDLPKNDRIQASFMR